MVVCDGLKGLPDGDRRPCGRRAITQTCIVHLLRNSFRYASKKDWAAIAKDLKPIYTAPRNRPPWTRSSSSPRRGSDRYPAIIKLWENAWPEFVPFLQFDKRDSHGGLHDKCD